MKGAQKVQSQFCDSAEPGNWRYDILNRMTSSRNNDTGRYNSYMYRADGLRVHKGNFMNPTFDFEGGTFYRYDGQMSIEEYSVGSNHLVNGITRNTLGARGIDMIQRATAGLNETSYPLYDAHGNMTAQLLKNGASFTVANEKSYDAWGGIRAGNSNPEYKGRYCATLGHTQDDESSLIYMRARYYEPSSGRFTSQDVAKDGSNWLIYCNNNPLNLFDATGLSPMDDARDLSMVIAGIMTSKLAMSLVMYIALAGFCLGFSIIFGCCIIVPVVGIQIAGAAMQEEFSAGVDVLNGSLKSGGWGFGKMSAEPGDRGFKGGVLSECIGFLTAYSGAMDFMFRHIDWMN